MYFHILKQVTGFCQQENSLIKKFINPFRINVSQAFITLLFRGLQYQQDVGTFERLQNKAMKRIKLS